MKSYEVPQPVTGFSRRSLLALVALSPVSALLSCRTAGMPSGPAPRLDAADREILRFADSYNALVRREPNLPGMRALAQTDRLVPQLSSAELSLLTGALYLQARERLLAAPRPFTDADFRTAMANPAGPERYGQTYLVNTLRDATERAAASPEYALALQRPPPRGWRCIDEDGFEIFTFGLCLRLIFRGILFLEFVFL